MTLDLNDLNSHCQLSRWSLILLRILNRIQEEYDSAVSSLIDWPDAGDESSFDQQYLLRFCEIINL